MFYLFIYSLSNVKLHTYLFGECLNITYSNTALSIRLLAFIQLIIYIYCPFIRLSVITLFYLLILTILIIPEHHFTSVATLSRIYYLDNGHFTTAYIYTIILHKSVCRRSQTAGRNSCSIVSGDVSNCSVRIV